jgi:MFS family permease
MKTNLRGSELRDFWVLSFGHLSAYCGFFGFFQYSLHLKTLGIGEWPIGLVMGAGTVAGIFGMPWIIAIVRIVERKALMLWGIAVMAISTLGLALLQAVDWQMVALMVLRGLGFIGYLIASGTYVAQLLPAEEKGRWLGIYLAFTQISLGLGPTIAEQVIRTHGHDWFFALILIFQLLALLLIAMIHARPFESGSQRLRLIRPALVLFSQLVDRLFRRAYVVLLLVSCAVGSIFSFCGLYARSRGVDSGVFFIAYALASTGVRFVTAGVIDRVTRKQVVSPSLAVMGIGLVILGAAHTTPLLVLSGILIGLSVGLANPTLLAGLLDRSTPESHGTTVGGFHFTYNTGLTLGPVFAGWVVEHAGFASVWWAASAMSLIAAGIYLGPMWRYRPSMSRTWKEIRRG